jgi:ornithine cyclodeaminase
VLFISEREAEQLVSLADAIEAVEAAFGALEAGEAESFPVISAWGMSHEQRWAIKAGRSDTGTIGCKIGTYWPHNLERGLEAHASTVLLLDPQTGHPLAVIRASYLTALRTAAADAIGVRHLARPDASRLALVGSGHQAWFDLQAIGLVRALQDIRVWNRNPERAREFAARACAAGYPARPLALQNALDGADIVVTATAAIGPLFAPEWVSPGAHISAMGADAPGKQELPTELLARARVFVDVIAQSVTIGECQSAYRAGLLDCARLTTLGAVIRGEAPGRSSPDELTVFDSSGTAIQDLSVCARAVAGLQASRNQRELERFD